MRPPKYDFHISHLASIEKVWDVAEELGVQEDQVWRPYDDPMAGGAS